MRGVILYGSCYGTTQKYAECFARETGLPCLPCEQAGEARDADTLVYFGGLYAGGVLGLSKTIRSLPNAANMRLLLVTVGLADPQDPVNVKNIRVALQRQLPKDVFSRAQIFHLRGGIDYSRLSRGHKAMMALLYHHDKRLPPEKQSAESRAIVETYNSKVDFFDAQALGAIRRALETV